MVSDWLQTTWGELATLEYGKALRGYQTGSGPYQVFGTNGPIGWHTEALCPFGSVIVGRKGAYRGIHYSTEPFWVIDTAFYLKPRKPFHMGWAYYQLLTQDINGMDSGSAIPSTSREEFYKLPVLVPPLEEQERIALILGLLDDRIHLLHDLNTTLESVTQAIFKAWFIDFDPVRAKAEGREPEGMEAETAAVFPSEFEDSELGPIPKGWRCGVFGDLATRSKDTINPQSRPDTMFEHYSIPAFDATQLPVIEPGAAIKSNKAVIPAGSVLMSKLNPHIPRVWLPGDVTRRAICSTEFLPWVPTSGTPSEYVYCLLRSPAFINGVQTLVTGTSNSHQRVSAEQVATLPIVIPSSEVRLAFGKTIAPLLTRTIQGRYQGQALASLRDELLPRLVSGQLRVTEAEKALEEAVV